MIYESPDAGKTIFSRHARDSNHLSLSEALDRQISYSYEDSDYFTHRQQIYKEEQLWVEIRKAALTNTNLQDILNQAIILYKLCKEE